MILNITPSVFCALGILFIYGFFLVVSSESKLPLELQRSKRQLLCKQLSDGGVCVIPDPLQYGKYRTSQRRCRSKRSSPACQLLPEAFVPPDWALYFRCNRGYALNTTQTASVCYKGDWYPELPVCNKLCPPLRSPGVQIYCYTESGRVSCDQPMKPGTTASQSCKEYYHPEYDGETSLKLTCLDNGFWDEPLLYCVPDEVCKQQEGKTWRCKKLKNCFSAQKNLSKGKRPEICQFEGPDPNVCCEPESQGSAGGAYGGAPIAPFPPPDLLPGELEYSISSTVSMQMCEKYSKAVYISDPKSNGVDEEKIDSCAIVEPINPVFSNYVSDAPQLSSDAQPREFPHMAIIGFGDKSTTNQRVNCTGSLISERYVLTVAHCSKFSPSWVRLGDYNVDSTMDDEEHDSSSVIYNIIDIINHPEYKDDGITPYHDIALYKLDKDVEFNEYIRPICLQNFNLYIGNEPEVLIASGWGDVEYDGEPGEVLQKLNLLTEQYINCQEKYNAYYSYWKIDVKTDLMKNLTICASLPNGSHACMARDGAPLQDRIFSPYCMYNLVGLSAYGVTCSSEDRYPGIFTKVSHYLPWIVNIVWPKPS